MQFILDHEYVLTLFASLAIFLFCFPKRKLFYLTFALSFFLIELYWHFRPLPGPLDFLIIYLLLIGSAYLTFNTNIFGVLFIVTTTFCVQHIAYKGAMILVTLIDYNLRGQIFYVLMELFIIVVMNAIMYFTFLKKFKMENDLQINNGYLLAVAILIILFNIVVSYFVEDPLIEDKNYVIYSLVNLYSIISSLAGIVILFMSSNETKLENDNKTLEVILKNDEKKYELAKITQEQINIKYHDLKHYIQENKLNEDDVLEIEQNGKIFKSIYYTGNKTLDTVLLEKNLTCLKLNIHFLTIADGTLLNFMKINHLYSIFSNLIDNAIECVSKIDQIDRRIIRLMVSKQRNSVLIDLENTCLVAPIFKNNEIVTSKEDKENHGFGIKSIKSIVNKYNGHLYMSYENSKFISKIVFSLSDENK